ncbi:MAG: PAS domain S-box protein [Leptolyngbyaceae cyanobacterium CRU_2_3]|nr:PAS domain S-box protein [Leptolyngbyaceae cyanobacterium CRU_2_3]
MNFLLWMGQIHQNTRIMLLLCGVGLLVAVGIVWIARRFYTQVLATKEAAYAERLAQANQALEQEVAKRQQVEQSLHESDRKFRAIFDQTLQLVDLLKPDGTVLEANQASLNFSGLKRSQVMGRFLWETQGRELSSEAQEQIKQAIARAAQGKSVRYEVEVLRQSHFLTTVNFCLRPIWNEAGQVSLLLCEGQDISERKREETALKISERNLRSLFNSAHDAIFIYATDGTILNVNDRMLEMYEVSREQALQFSIQFHDAAATHPLKITPTLWNRALNGEILCFECQAKRSGDGLIFDVEVTLRRIVFNNKTAILANIRDISDRKQTAAALEAQKSLLYKVIDAIPSCIFVQDRQGQVIAINQAGADLCGATVEEIIGNQKSPWGHLSATPLAESLAVNRAVMVSRQPQICPAQIIHHQGEPRWYQTIISPFLDQQGRVQGMIGSAIDITELKRTEEELRQTKNAAEAANKAKSAFLANMSHELRTPLNAILGFSRLMAHDSLTPHQKQQIEAINRNSEHLLQLINEVLSIAKIESGHIDLRRGELQFTYTAGEH